MTIEIIGGGALGMLIGARLALSGGQIRMRAKTPIQAKLLNNEGIHYTDSHNHTTVVPATSSSSSAVGSTQDTEWILLGVKQTAIDESVYSLLKHIATPTTPVICVQNGIGHMEKLRAALPEIPFFTAVSTEGALRTGLNHVMHTGKGSLWIEACPDHCKQNAHLLDARNNMLSSLRAANVDAHLSDDMNTMVFRKLLVNSVINPLTAIYGVNNGQLPEDPIRRTIMKALLEETVCVLEAKSGECLGENLWEYILRICQDTANNESSMLSDVRAHRQTEVKWINGGVLDLANQMDVQAPLNRAMVTLIESLGYSPPTLLA